MIILLVVAADKFMQKCVVNPLHQQFFASLLEVHWINKNIIILCTELKGPFVNFYHSLEII